MSRRAGTDVLKKIEKYLTLGGNEPRIIQFIALSLPRMNNLGSSRSSFMPIRDSSDVLVQNAQ